MTNELWFNIPVRDLAKTKKFFQSLGFESTRDAPEMVGFLFGEKKNQIMMVKEEFFEKYASSTVSDTSKGSELLISFDAFNKEEVDKMAEKVIAAGGQIFSGPSSIQGWMYGFGFADLDGHRWNMVYFEWDKMPKE